MGGRIMSEMDVLKEELIKETTKLQEILLGSENKEAIESFIKLWD